MIRIFLILFSLSGCGNLPIAYFQNFSEVNNVIFGFPDYKITKDIYDNYDSSFIKIRFGRGPHAILVLAYIEDDVFEWVGADDVRIFTSNGKIIRTVGLPHNFELQDYSTNDFKSTNASYELVNLYNPDLYLSKMEKKFSIQDGQLQKFGNAININKITERFKIESIGWSDKNVYYQNTETLEIERSEQNIHPRLPTLKIEFYIKY